MLKDARVTSVKLDGETRRLLGILAKRNEGNVSRTMRDLIRDAGRAELQKSETKRS